MDEVEECLFKLLKISTTNDRMVHLKAFNEGLEFKQICSINESWKSGKLDIDELLSMIKLASQEPSPYKDPVIP